MTKEKRHFPIIGLLKELKILDYSHKTEMGFIRALAWYYTGLFYPAWIYLFQNSYNIIEIIHSMKIDFNYALGFAIQLLLICGLGLMAFFLSFSSSAKEKKYSKFLLLSGGVFYNEVIIKILTGVIVLSSMGNINADAQQLKDSDTANYAGFQIPVFSKDKEECSNCDSFKKVIVNEPTFMNGVVNGFVYGINLASRNPKDKNYFVGFYCLPECDSAIEAFNAYGEDDFLVYDLGDRFFLSFGGEMNAEEALKRIVNLKSIFPDIEMADEYAFNDR